jgi:Putative member of DMT superfamily (DUF486)
MLTSPYVLTILMLLGSNIFMTIAWYGHLRFKEVPLAGVIVASWLIAFVEYCLAVPANRWGSEVYTTAQTGSDHARGLRRLLGAVSQGAHDLELRHRLCAGCVRRVLHLSRSALSWRHRRGAVLGAPAGA